MHAGWMPARFAGTWPPLPADCHSALPAVAWQAQSCTIALCLSPAAPFPCPPVPFRAGQALYLSNHITRVETPLLRPPSPGTNGAGGIPGWVLPVAVVLAGGDAASSLLDPALPLILAGAVVATVGTGKWPLVVVVVVAPLTGASTVACSC